MKGGTSKFGLPYTVLERGLITVLKFNCMFTGHDFWIIVYAVFIFNNCSDPINMLLVCLLCLSLRKYTPYARGRKPDRLPVMCRTGNLHRICVREFLAFDLRFARHCGRSKLDCDYGVGLKFPCKFGFLFCELLEGGAWYFLTRWL